MALRFFAPQAGTANSTAPVDPAVLQAGAQQVPGEVTEQSGYTALPTLRDQILQSFGKFDWDYAKEKGNYKVADDLARSLEAAGVTDLSKLRLQEFEYERPQKAVQTGVVGDSGQFRFADEFGNDVGAWETAPTLDPIKVKGTGLAYDGKILDRLQDVGSKGDLGESRDKARGFTSTDGAFSLGDKSADPGKKLTGELKDGHPVLAFNSFAGKGHTNVYAAKGPDGQVIFYPQWASSSDASTVREVAIMVAAMYAGVVLAPAAGAAAAGAAGGAGTAAGAAAGMAAQGAVTGAAMNAGMGAMMGASGGQILKAAGKGALTGAIGGAIRGYAGASGVPDWAVGAMNGAASAALGGGSGDDVLKGAATGAVGGGLLNGVTGSGITDRMLAGAVSGYLQGGEAGAKSGLISGAIRGAPSLFKGR